ncbi:unnamed protein product [Larinioides sclopetarius]|uniref:C2H2-type domain-containing protein n=1 Tax=Larinioides sclopetarius TaxID=280406 RepID=A0AAV2AEN0_9ARAC
MGSPKKDYRNLRYKCQYCFYATNRPSHLKRHYLTHTQERPFACTVCGKSFNQKVSLQEHSRIHTGEKPFQCDVCFVRFTQRSSLKNHKRLHMKNDTTGISDLEYLGNSDGTSDVSFASLKSYNKSDVIYRCDVCSYSSRLLGNLKRHYLIHTGQRPYVCSFCGKAFNQKVTLTSHKRLHTDVPAFVLPSPSAEHEIDLEEDWQAHHSCPIFHKMSTIA